MNKQTKNSCNHRNWFHIAEKKRGEKTFAKSKKIKITS